MSTFIIILLAAGFAYLVLFNKPTQPSTEDLVKWFSSRLELIAANLENDIERDKLGEYAHAGKQSFEKRGSITYVLPDKKGARFDVSDKITLRPQDIINTTGYKNLETKVQRLKLQIRLDENAVEGDGVESFDQLDEYTYDYPRYYTVTISGW